MGERKSPEELAKMHSIKVDNIPYSCTKEDLQRAFDKYGEIGDVYIPRDRETDKVRGFAFVRYLKKDDAEEALRKMEGYDLDGRELRVQEARPMRSRDEYKGNSRDYRGGGGGGGYNRDRRDSYRRDNDRGGRDRDYRRNDRRDDRSRRSRSPRRDRARR